MKKEIKLLIGCSASGKSTYAKEFVQNNPSYKIVNRDKLREMLFGYNEENVFEYYLSKEMSKNEKLITTFQTTVMRQLLAQDFNIIVDNTNLDKNFLQQLLDEFPQCEFSFEFIGLDLSLEELIERDSQRLRKVGADVIKKQWDKMIGFDNILLGESKMLSPSFEIVPYVADESKPSVIICDLDGTLADYHSTRPAYGFEPSLIALDKVIEPVATIVDNMGIFGLSKIIFLSGRTNNYYEETLKWLCNNLCIESVFNEELTGISPTKNYDIELFMRKSNDFRKDNIIKYEIFDEHIRNNYNVKFAIDDRNSITSLWNSVGIFCLNVNQTGKEF